MTDNKLILITLKEDDSLLKEDVSLLKNINKTNILSKNLDISKKIKDCFLGQTLAITKQQCLILYKICELSNEFFNLTYSYENNEEAY